MHKGFADLSLTSWVRRLAERLSGVTLQNKEGFVQSAAVFGGFGGAAVRGIPPTRTAFGPSGYSRTRVHGGFGVAW